MRIISKFQDYYDSVQAYSIDKSLVYVREKEIVEMNLEKERYQWGIKDLEPFDARLVDDFKFANCLIGFCGKIYNVIKSYDFGFDSKYKGHFTNYTEKDIDRIDILYNKEDFLKLYKEKRINFKKASLNHSDWGSENTRIENMIKYLEKDYNNQKYTDIFYNYKVPCFVMEPKVERNFRTNIVKLRLNPCLKDLDFQRIIDSYTTYQEIAMFISGVLGVGEPETITLNDKEKIKKKGFDKWSFRKPPKKK